jgi:hypothetical protein
LIIVIIKCEIRLSIHLIQVVLIDAFAADLIYLSVGG